MHQTTMIILLDSGRRTPALVCCCKERPRTASCVFVGLESGVTLACWPSAQRVHGGFNCKQVLWHGIQNRLVGTGNFLQAMRGIRVVVVQEWVVDGKGWGCLPLTSL